MIVSLRETGKKYGIIYTDPPWPQKKGNLRKVRPGQKKELDYKTLCLEEIMEIHDIVLKENTEEKHNVFCWVIDKYIPEAEDIFDRLGYKIHARMVWDKGNGIASAYTVRYSHEYLYWFYKPKNMLMVDKEARGKYSTVIRENSTYHSRKPEAVYKMLEDMFKKESKLELFARKEREGWDSFGDEIEGRKG